MTDPGAPTPLSLVPAQRESSGLDDAVAARSMHPSIPWSNGDGLKHGRASTDVDAGTRCGLPGPLELAGKDADPCGACYPPVPPDAEVVTAEEAARRDAEIEARNKATLAEHVQHVHLADRSYREGTPVTVAGELYFDGERVALAHGVWSVTGGQQQETLLTLRVPRAAITVTARDEHGRSLVRLFGRLVLPTDSAPFPDPLDGHLYDLVDVTIIVGLFSVGPRPEVKDE